MKTATIRVADGVSPVRTVSTQYPYIVATATLGKATVQKRTRDPKVALRAYNEFAREVGNGHLIAAVLVDPSTGRELAARRQVRDAAGYLAGVVGHTNGLPL